MKFGIRRNLIGLVIFYFIFFTFLNAFYGSSINVIPSYLQNAINFFSTASHVLSTPISFSGGIVGVLTSIGKDILYIVYILGDVIFLIIAIISLIVYYPYIISLYVPSPLNSIIITITVVILIIDVITGIRIFFSGISGNDE